MTDKIIDSLEVKKMRDMVASFGEMAEEIINTFQTIDSINIKSFNDMANPNSLASIIPKANFVYLDIVVNTNNETQFDKTADVIDLLQSAFKESGIVKKLVINPTLEKFFTENKISSVHEMIGSTQEDLIEKFDSFIENEQNYELTFAQKINKFKK